MIFAGVEINNFRNLRYASLNCSPALNLIVGGNASGKTSVMEALYFLGRTRSFRTRQTRELIQFGSDRFRIVASMRDQRGLGRRNLTVGIERNAHQLTARVGGVPVVSLAELAIQVPVLLLDPDSHRLLDGGPQQRRRFLNWSLFHSTPSFLVTWKRYESALRNRNAALRRDPQDRSIEAWDDELVRAAEALDDLRSTFCQTLQRDLQPLVQDLLSASDAHVDYRRGWSQKPDLATQLRAGRELDRRYGYTRLGPHRADFQVTLDGRSVLEVLSRGQQKLLVIALILAQAQCYRAATDRDSILLIDDLPAELDHTHRDRVMACLLGQPIQLFVTAIEGGLLNIAASKPVARFNIDRGEIRIR